MSDEKADKSQNRSIRHAVQSLISAFLIFFQYVPAAGPWYGSMIFPLAVYFSSLALSHPEFLSAEISLILFSEKLFFGRMVTLVGFVIFLVACVQFLRRNRGIVTTGLYSLVRHPQYFGLIVMTLGTSIMCFQFIGFGRFEVTYVWLMQVLGYVLLSLYEEQHLQKECEKEYAQYKKRVSFIFPIPSPHKIPEPILTLMTAAVIAFLLTFLKY